MKQRKIKRLLAYSSIGHVGYILITLSSGSLEGFHASVIYIVTYMLMSVGIWSVTSCLERHPTKRTRTLTDLAMISKSNPVLALVLPFYCSQWRVFPH